RAAPRLLQRRHPHPRSPDRRWAGGSPGGDPSHRQGDRRCPRRGPALAGAEREEFVRLFAELLERSLIGGIAGRIRLPDGIQVSYVGESVEGAVATVWTTLLSKRGLDLPFTYRMIQRAGRWAICDVIIDGVSVAANYRAQFFRVMRSSSYQELVRQMRARVQEPLTAPRVATALGDDVVIVSVIPAMRPIHMIRKEWPQVRMW